MSQRRLILAACGLLALSACDGMYAPTERPDYAIRVTPTPSGGVAEMPECPSWSASITDPLDNQPMPQYGCASARNLAAMSETPTDLVQGRPLGEQRGVTAVGAVRRYDNNQTRGLVWPGEESNQNASTTAASASSALTGDVTGGAGGAAPSTSSSAGATAAP